MITVRLALLEEKGELRRSFAASTILVIEEDGVDAGHLCLTASPDGSMLAHDVEVRASSVFAYAEVLTAARARLLEMGFEEFWINTTEETPKRVIAFWEKFGARPVTVLYRVRL